MNPSCIPATYETLLQLKMSRNKYRLAEAMKALNEMRTAYERGLAMVGTIERTLWDVHAKFLDSKLVDYLPKHLGLNTNPYGATFEWNEGSAIRAAQRRREPGLLGTTSSNRLPQRTGSLHQRTRRTCRDKARNFMATVSLIIFM